MADQFKQLKKDIDDAVKAGKISKAEAEIYRNSAIRRDDDAMSEWNKRMAGSSSSSSGATKSAPSSSGAGAAQRPSAPHPAFQNMKYPLRSKEHMQPGHVKADSDLYKKLTASTPGLKEKCQAMPRKDVWSLYYNVTSLDDKKVIEEILAIGPDYYTADEACS